MKSRLAVSILFTLLAATCIPNAMVAVGKLRSRADKVLHCSALHMTGRAPLDRKGGGMTVLQTFSPEHLTTTLESLRATNLQGSQDKNLEFLAMASRIREIFDRTHNN